MLARSQNMYPEVPAIISTQVLLVYLWRQADTEMFPKFKVATSYFLCNPAHLNLSKLTPRAKHIVFPNHTGHYWPQNYSPREPCVKPLIQHSYALIFIHIRRIRQSLVTHSGRLSLLSSRSLFIHSSVILSHLSGQYKDGFGTFRAENFSVTLGCKPA